MASLSSRSDRKYAALETLLCELGKEALDGVEPGSGCRGEVEDKPPMFFEPLHDVGMLVGGIVVDDDMDRLFLGHSGLDDVQKLANNLALKDIERREQGGDAMANGLVSIAQNQCSLGDPSLILRSAYRAVREGWTLFREG
jgi:hypothetical protein